MIIKSGAPGVTAKYDVFTGSTGGLTCLGGFGFGANGSRIILIGFDVWRGLGIDG